MSKTEENQSKNIGLFGSSFNPPHPGHLAVVSDLLTKGVFDEIWLVPVFEHAFGKSLPPFEDRVALIKILFANLLQDKVKISLIEKDLPTRPTYTFHMVQALQKQHPHLHFSLILGTDTKQDLPKWHRFEELKKMISFYFIPRKGYEDGPYPEISSSEIREKLIQKEDLNGLLPAHLIQEIEARNLISFWEQNSNKKNTSK